MIKVDIERCSGCGECLDACSNEAISLFGGKAVIDADTCLECGACVPACPLSAIYQVELPVLIERIPAPVIAPQPILQVERSSARLAPWVGSAVAFVGREIVPRAADALIAAVERRLSRPETSPATIHRPMALQDRSLGSRPRRQRRRAGWR